MAKADYYVDELAETIDNMFIAGKLDPSAREVAEEHFQKTILGGEIIDGIRKRLPRIKNILALVFEHPVYLVNERYYVKFKKKNKIPITEKEARSCLPTGHGVRSYGIRLNTDADNDLIYRASLDRDLKSGTAKTKISADRVLSDVDDGRMSENLGASIMDQTDRQLMPKHPALREKLREQLPAPKGEDKQ